ncbi:cytochrome P450 [Goodfellowiella coeruleoviolacea]|uniref:Cytochrome P450 n=1 Tax=Goodfellowiella coeruleoviolacea TaxID=334858 RepID=A0AAE3GDZ4_9PSEU|nr:cytochrome P450 [Goodfellowiella coeruleoviolacea]MCP2165554.1 Cytochrome P450 [Goodfellowiella coeruleoviolacea]
MTETPVLPLYMRRDEFNPIPELAELRDGPGIRKVTTAFGVPAWLVSRFADVRFVFGNPDLFSNQRAQDLGLLRSPGLSEEENKRLRAGQMLAFDPPDHTRLRRMLTPEFTVRRMRRLEPRVHEIVTDHLDAMQRTGPPADLVADFALPIPSLVICELLGVPYADRADFQHRSSRVLDVSLPLDQRAELQREFRAYMGELVARAKADPGEDLLGMLVREHGADLSTDELVGIANLLLIAGHETTSNMLSLGTLALLRHPDQVGLLRAEPERIDAAVEELLRWLSIVHTGTMKVTTTEVEIAGQTIGAGELVVCTLAAANRDPALAEDPERLDITRGLANHLAFGHGVHHCLGAPLARMEMRTAFPALLRRFPDLRVVTDELDFRAFSVVYGLRALPVAW